MPIIDLTLAEGILDDAQKRRLVRELSSAVAQWTGMPEDSPGLPALWTLIDERPAGALWTGLGEPAARALYRVQITVGVGVLDDERKRGLVADVTERVLQVEDADDGPRGRARVLCHIHELPDGNWGVAGRIWLLSDIVDFNGMDRTTVPGLRRAS
jgi:phenylpyruvate tautomerase PptA (4-oxalocrotonate tautomerase family)